VVVGCQARPRVRIPPPPPSPASAGCGGHSPPTDFADKFCGSWQFGKCKMLAISKAKFFLKIKITQQKVVKVVGVYSKDLFKE